MRQGTQVASATWKEAVPQEGREEGQERPDCRPGLHRRPSRDSRREEPHRRPRDRPDQQRGPRCELADSQRQDVQLLPDTVPANEKCRRPEENAGSCPQGLPEDLPPIHHHVG